MIFSNFLLKKNHIPCLLINICFKKFLKHDNVDVFCKVIKLHAISYYIKTAFVEMFVENLLARENSQRM